MSDTPDTTHRAIPRNGKLSWTIAPGLPAVAGRGRPHVTPASASPAAAGPRAGGHLVAAEYRAGWVRPGDDVLGMPRAPPLLSLRATTRREAHWQGIVTHGHQHPNMPVAVLCFGITSTTGMGRRTLYRPVGNPAASVVAAG